MGILLHLLANFLRVIISPFAELYAWIKTDAAGFDSYNRELAVAQDQYGNRLLSYLFNDILITKDGYRFGNIDETISSVIGKNKVKGTLTACGKTLDAILNLIDKDHSVKAIDKTVNNE